MGSLAQKQVDQLLRSTAALFTEKSAVKKLSITIPYRQQTVRTLKMLEMLSYRHFHDANNHSSTMAVWLHSPCVQKS